VGILAFSMLHHDAQKNRLTVLGFSAFTIVIGIAAVLVQNNVIPLSPLFTEMSAYLILATLIAFILYGYKYHYSVEFSRTLVLMILILSTIVFWSLFEQSAGSMTLFADRSVDRNIGGVSFVASQVASLNPGFIML